MKKILFATDLSANADRAMERAIQLTKRHDAQLYIVHVLPQYKAKTLQDSLKQDTADLILEYFNKYRDAKGLSPKIEVLMGPTPHMQILDYAQKIKADMIVIGLHGKAKFRDLFVGTTVERLARKSTKPVLIVKDKSTGHYTSIVGTDEFAPASRAALRTAMELAPKGVFEIIHCFQIPVAYPTTAEFALAAYEQTEKTQNKAMDAFLKTEQTHFKKTHNGEAKRLGSRLVEGPAYQTLMKEAKTAKADLITLGAHGASIITPFKLGGLAEDVLANPPCDILLVRE